MNYLKNKTILLISPQRWDFISISKHHYAIELCKIHNRVYFLNPPSGKKLSIKNDISCTNLFILDYNLPCPGWVRFKLRWWFNLLMKRNIRKITSIIPRKLDIVWCFEPNLFSNLQLFKATITIFHPVDLILYPYQIKPAFNADYIFSVSNTILKKTEISKTPSFFINHGLNGAFESLANQNLKNLKPVFCSKVRAGYIGNLLIASIDHLIFQKIISDNKDVEFHFWGPYDINIQSTNKTIIEFVRFLQLADNVVLRGSMSPENIIEELHDISVFLLVYEYNETLYDCSNSHKIMEYLSTGKMIISNYIELYSIYPELICMPETHDNRGVPDLFRKAIHNLEYYNDVQHQKQRIEFALDNTYVKQIEKIDSILSN